MRLDLSAVVLPAVLAACTAAPPVRTIPRIAALDDFPAAWAAAACAFGERCPASGAPWETFDYDGCVALVMDVEGDSRTLGFAMDEARAGRFRFDATLAQSFVESVARAPCADPPRLLPWRSAGFVGTLGEGQRCARGECAPGLYCDDRFSNGECAAACRLETLVPLGGLCGEDAETCDGASAVGTATCVLTGAAVSGLPYRCLDHQQTVLVGEGESCDEWQVVGTVATLHRCREGLICPIGTHLCVRIRGEGEECDPVGTPCAAGTRCTSPDPPRRSYTGPPRHYRCRRPELRNGAGESCSFDEEGALCNPYRRLGCDGSACRLFPVPREGEACLSLRPRSNDLPVLVCGPGQRCMSDQRCRAPYALDAPCVEGRECRALYCDPATHRCAQPWCGMN